MRSSSSLPAEYGPALTASRLLTTAVTAAPPADAAAPSASRRERSSPEHHAPDASENSTSLPSCTQSGEGAAQLEGEEGGSAAAAAASAAAAAGSGSAEGAGAGVAASAPEIFVSASGAPAPRASGSRSITRGGEVGTKRESSASASSKVRASLQVAMGASPSGLSSQAGRSSSSPTTCTVPLDSRTVKIQPVAAPALELDASAEPSDLRRPSMRASQKPPPRATWTGAPSWIDAAHPCEAEGGICRTHCDGAHAWIGAPSASV